MSLLWMDGFDTYGTGAVGSSNMLDGVYAAVGNGGSGPAVPSWGPARTGQYCWVGDSVLASVRWALPAARDNLIIGHGYGVPSLPASSFTTSVMIFSNSNNETIATLFLGSTGTLILCDRTGAVVLQTSSPVIVTQNWHFLEYELDTNASTFRLDVDGTTVMNGSVTLPAPPAPDTSKTIAQVTFSTKGSASGVEQDYDDLTFRTPDGSHNNGFEGDLRVATLFPNADAADQGWTPQYRHKLGTGIFNGSNAAGGNSPSAASPAGYRSPSSTSTDLGNGDFTLEGFFRFFALPTGGNKAVLFSKWDETNNRRSFQLYLGGPTLENGNIVFRTSTNGQAGTVVEKISYPFPFGSPDLNRWYHVALVRASGELLLFLDGIQLGLPIADTDTYFAGTEPSSSGAQVEGSNTVIANTWLDGWQDEVRWTVGFARYTSNFTPTTVPFPRNSGGDPQFADVVLLLGFDNGMGDESSFARTVTAFGGGAAVTPDDGAAAFQTIYHHTPQDDTFVEAALLPATGILTLNSNPAVNDTVTVGTYTSGGSHAAVYKFVSALTTAFDVLIGASIAITLANLLAAINKAAGEGTLYGTGTIVNDDVFASGLPGAQMLVTATTSGSAGNSIASTSSLTDGASGWGDTTLDGGADIPGHSDFFFDRPPPNTVIVKAVLILNRSFKTDAGAGSVQVSWIGPLNTVSDGADNPLTLSPVYRWDVFETDPDTGSNITPSTIVGGRVRINRTA